MIHSGQTTGHSREHARDLRSSGHSPSSSHKISTVNLRHSSHLGTKFNHSAPTNVLFPSKVKTLAVLFSPYPREMKHIPRNLNLPPFWRLLVSIEMVQSIPTRALSRARGLSMPTHLTAVDRCEGLLATPCHSVWPGLSHACVD